MIAREFIKARLIETLMSTTGAGSDLEDPELLNIPGETYISLAGGDHIIDIEHLTSDVEQIITELKERDLIG